MRDLWKRRLGSESQRCSRCAHAAFFSIGSVRGVKQSRRLVSLADRLVRMPVNPCCFLQSPADEFHFGRFVGQYHMGTYLFDIHPPLGKLVLYYVSLLFGYDAAVCGYANIQVSQGA